MLNQTVLVGRIVSDPKINETINDKTVTTIPLAGQRRYNNEEGEYATEFIPCFWWDGVAQNVVEYCKKGDLIGIKGRIQSTADKIELIAERVTFLSSNKQAYQN